MEHAKRAFALRKYEQAVDYYATALEMKCAAHLVRYYASVVEIALGQNNAERVLRRTQTYTLHMAKRCSKTPYLRVLFWEMINQRKQKTRPITEVCALFTRNPR